MDHAAKLAFVNRQTKLALDHIEKTDAQHLYAGGTATNPNSGLMGNVNAALGLNNNYQAGVANTTAGTNANQLSTAYQQGQNGIIQQGQLATNTAPGQSQGLANEGVLGNQLLAESQGQGPNPAQAQLNQNTAQNVEATAALMAGQRGGGANPGLLAEQAARQGAATQQQAVGQEATLAAQQQLAAQNNLANLSSNQVNQSAQAIQGLNNSTQNEQNILQGANTAFNNSQVSMQGNVNQVNAGTSAANQNAAIGTLGGILNAGSSAFSAIGGLFAHGGMVRMDKGGNVLDAEHRAKIPTADFALPGKRYPIHDINHARNALARVSQYGTTAEKAKVRSAVSKKYPNVGVQKMAEGGGVDPYHNQNADPNQRAKTEAASASQKGGVASDSPIATGDWSHIWKANGGSIPSCSGGYMQMLADGGTAMPMLNEGQVNGAQSMVGQWLNSTPDTAGPQITTVAPLPQTTDLGKDLKADSSGGKGGGLFSLLKADGGDVVGKAKVKGDSYDNDTVPTMLSPGELVIDRETMADKGPAGQMARALKKHIESRNKKKGVA